MPPLPYGKLGKRPPRVDPRTMRLARFLPGVVLLPPPPDVICWDSNITDWGQMRNDSLGDCTCAALGHAIQVWTAATGSIFTLTDQVIADAYSAWCGYVPGDSATDQGGVELDVLNRFRQSGLGGEQLIGYADPDPGNLLHIQQSIAYFGGVYIGLALPVSAQSQSTWDATGYGWSTQPGSWGGHAVYVIGYDSRTLTCITWGRLQQMTWGFWQKYCEEAHTLLSKRWLESAVAAYQFPDLQQALAQL